MPNRYDVLYKKPKLHRKLPKQKEALARAIVASGKLRLAEDHSSNFARLLIPNEKLNFTFTQRELETPQLLSRSQRKITQSLAAKFSPEEAQKKAEKYIAKMRTDLKLKNTISEDTELKMARAIVLCNSLPVIRLLHLEGAEIFIAYGRSVSDVMDIATWQEVGESNGLQAIGRGENAVYVSCGGHPLLSDKERTYSSDGFPALARCMVIAAQETGHNADMKREAPGKWIGRFSADDWGQAPSALVGNARLKDKQRTHQIHRHIQRYGINLLAEWERHLTFYRQQKLHNTRWLLAWMKSKIGWRVFKLMMRISGHGTVVKIQKDPYPATLLRSAVDDMWFNIEPQADDYLKGSPQQIEAMMCMESLARVPQQVIKWGHALTRCCMPNLYIVYYARVVPACSKTVNQHRRKLQKTSAKKAGA